MPQSRSGTARGGAIDLAPDMIEFRDTGDYDAASDFYFPDDGALTGILPEFLSCADSTMVTFIPDGRDVTGDGADAGPGSPTGLDEFDFT